MTTPIWKSPPWQAPPQFKVGDEVAASFSQDTRPRFSWQFSLRTCLGLVLAVALGLSVCTTWSQKHQIAELEDRVKWLKDSQWNLKEQLAPGRMHVEIVSTAIADKFHYRVYIPPEDYSTTHQTHLLQVQVGGINAVEPVRLSPGRQLIQIEQCLDETKSWQLVLTIQENIDWKDTITSQFVTVPIDRHYDTWIITCNDNHPPTSATTLLQSAATLGVAQRATLPLLPKRPDYYVWISVVRYGPPDSSTEE